MFQSVSTVNTVAIKVLNLPVTLPASNLPVIYQ